jgi:DNA-directed RNA polymerase subunit RPC12/RpoP
MECEEVRMSENPYIKDYQPPQEQWTPQEQWIFCSYCNAKIVLNYPVKTWTIVVDKVYHNHCIEEAVRRAIQFNQVEKISHPALGCSGVIQNGWRCSHCGLITHGCLTEVIQNGWRCSHCGLITHGYTDENCTDCGKPSAFKVLLTNSDKI